MVRMIDLPPTKREAMERYPTPEFDTEAWVGGAPIRAENGYVDIVGRPHKAR